MSITARTLENKLKPVIDASPYDIEIALQDGGHRWVARIFWPHARFPELLWDNPEQEIRSVEKGRMCIEYRLCNVDQPTYEDLHFSGCDFWGDMRAALENYILYLQGEDPDADIPPSAPPMKKNGQTVPFTGVRRERI